MTAVAYATGNRLLDALPARELAGLEHDVEIISLAAHQTTNLLGGAVEYVDFPIDAVLSVVAMLLNGDTVEVGTVGCESFVESDAALDWGTLSRTAFCQVQGRVARMPLSRFNVQMAGGGAFERLVRHNLRATLFSTQQFVACNVRHSVRSRCARWLAMTADRVGSKQFILTHDFLAIMLGVRRAGVSEAAEALHQIGAIAYRRGVVTVLNRELLDAEACECYGACRQAYVDSLA